jgi:hypothetical protein
MKVKYFLYSACVLCSGCITSPTTGGKKLLGLMPIPFTKPAVPLATDPYAIWQQWAIFIIIAGIVIGVIDFFMDRKLTLIGPLIAGCGLVVSIWGITLPIVAKLLPWAIGIALAGWIVLRYIDGQKKRGIDNG